MNNGDVFKKQTRLQGGDGALLGDGTQISVHHVVSYLVLPPHLFVILHWPLWDHIISVG